MVVAAATARVWPLAKAIVIGTVSISGNQPICMDAVEHALRCRVLKRGKTMVGALPTPPGGSLACVGAFWFVGLTGHKRPALPHRPSPVPHAHVLVSSGWSCVGASWLIVSGPKTVSGPAPLPQPRFFSQCPRSPMATLTIS